ncbi:aldehyde dehydrogenase family protein [Aeropyrum camini]|uniref:NAD-dependent aldehyde dehydrogenase n=1 Tax=Aeropyrum camini SY1 = JCM 12091 TaxID=1198449 RepID=U3TCC4_9CREN|nr:aldehyde dehydrogenase [Aeropyrum camini]BAN89598.1 NAD-dependent aldehyde dehydrogenase [Aeropyrum camini SY1 = JCM 12091]
MERTRVVKSFLKALESYGFSADARGGKPVLHSIVKGRFAEGEEAFSIDTPIDGSRLFYATILKTPISEHGSSPSLWEISPGEAVEPGFLEALEAELSDADETLVDILVLDTGKTRVEARLEVEASLKLLRSAAGLGESRFRGVLVALPSYTMPLYTTVYSLYRAAERGMGVLLKPPRKAPLAPTLVAAAASRLGMEDGLNMVYTTGASLLGLSRVFRSESIIFTCPSKAAIARAGTIASRGRSVAIVSAGSLDEVTARFIMYGRALHAGQACGSIGWVIAVGRLSRNEVDALIDAAESIRVGDPSDPSTAMGPLIKPGLAEASEKYVNYIEGMGGVVPTGYRREGRYVWPSVVEGVVKDPVVLSRDPRFPVLPIVTVSSPEEAASIAAMTGASDVLAFQLGSSSLRALGERLSGLEVFVDPIPPGGELPTPGSFILSACLTPERRGEGVILESPYYSLAKKEKAETYR